MFQPPLLINGHRFLNLCSIFSKSLTVSPGIKFFHLEKNIKATDFKLSTNVHKKLLYETIERHFMIYVYESSLWQHSLVKKCYFEYTLKNIYL